MIMQSIFPTLAYVSFVAYSYVLALHIKAPQGYRNDPQIIKFRITRIAIVSVINSVLTPFVLVYVLKTAPNFKAAFGILGFSNCFKLGTFVDMLKTLFLFLTLFSGPVFDILINQDFHERYFTSLEMIRDLLVAPLTEELFYTSLTTGSILAYELSVKSSLYPTKSTYSATTIHNRTEINIYLMLTPLLFGFAHLHHAIELKRQNKNWVQIIITCVFQCVYTTIFGYITNRLFVNTGSLACCFVAHSFCNFMGFPKLDVTGCRPYKLFYWGSLLFGIHSFSSYFERLTYNPNN